MARIRWGVVGLGTLCLAIAPVHHEANVSRLQAAPPAEKPADPSRRDVLATAAKIDQAIESAWVENGVTATALSNDAEFLRRVYLDLTGCIPTVRDVRDFLADKSADKRLQVVEKLLKHPRFVEHFTHVWRSQMLPRTNDQQLQQFAVQMEAWLRRHFRANTPYDKMVRELLTTAVAGNGQMPANGAPSALVFFQANEQKPENLAASTSRLFLGVNLECAQCHDHPFATWKRKQFWEYAAFFASIQGGPGRPGRPGSPMAKAPTEKRTIKYKQGTKDIEVEARFLDGKVPAWKDNVAVRATLADWMTSPANPFFARNAVNRMWAHFFGIGIIDPVDEPGDDHPPSHPELLDQLTKDFTDHKFDLKFVIRAITASKTYQLSSATATEPTPEEARLFTHMAVRGLSPEQLFDSLSQATGDSQQLNRRFAEQRQRILSRFANPSDKPTEFQTSILQALSLMNGEYMEESTKLDPSLLAQKGVEALQKRSGAALSAIADAPFFDTKGRIEALYLSALSRKPRPAELEKLVKYVDKGGPSGNSKRALADVFWALLNSPEFFLNH
jgi:hypothetical protein